MHVLLAPRSAALLLGIAAGVSLPSLSRAAITITVSPAAEGTRFRIGQTADNPRVRTDAVTGGALAEIPLSPAAVHWQPALASYEEAFGAPLGTIERSDGNGERHAAITGLSFTTVGSAPTAVLDLSAILMFDPLQTTQLTLFSALDDGAMAAIPFATFRAGSYREDSIMFGSITTIVVPEPASALQWGCLFSLACLFRKRVRPSGQARS